MRTLILVDIQNDFVLGGALPVPGGHEVVPAANRIQPAFDLVVATQDWHPAGHASFASSYRGKQPFDTVEVQGVVQVLWPDHCVQDTDGARFHPELLTDRVAAVFRKGMDPAVDSYSGFYDNARRHSTGLAGYLREKGATTLHICGLAGDYCVYFTAADALQEGFKAILVEDAIRSIDPAAYEALKGELIAAGASVASSGSL